MLCQHYAPNTTCCWVNTTNNPSARSGASPVTVTGSQSHYGPSGLLSVNADSLTLHSYALITFLAGPSALKRSQQVIRTCYVDAVVCSLAKCIAAHWCSTASRNHPYTLIFTDHELGLCAVRHLLPVCLQAHACLGLQRLCFGPCLPRCSLSCHN
jgi:hypothetical protein